MSLRVLEVLFDRRGREGRRWHPLRQLERELGQVPRSMDQVVEVIPLRDGEDSPRRVLCPWRAHPLASTLPAVARATAGKMLAGGCARQDRARAADYPRRP